MVRAVRYSNVQFNDLANKIDSSSSVLYLLKMKFRSKRQSRDHCRVRDALKNRPITEHLRNPWLSQHLVFHFQVVFHVRYACENQPYSFRRHVLSLHWLRKPKKSSKMKKTGEARARRSTADKCIKVWRQNASAPESHRKAQFFLPVLWGHAMDDQWCLNTWLMLFSPSSTTESRNCTSGTYALHKKHLQFWCVKR